MALRGALWRKMQDRKKRKQAEKKEKEYVKVEKKEISRRELVSKKWEYRVVVLQTSSKRKNKAVESWTETLTKLGNQGWELVAAIPMVAQLGFFGSPPHVRCFFKREVR